MGNVRGLQNLPPELARLAEQMATYGSCISLISFSGAPAATSFGSCQSPQVGSTAQGASAGTLGSCISLISFSN